MKKFLIGIVFLMFAFAVGAIPLVEVDIGEKVECEALEVDQLAAIDYVFTNTENQNQTLLNELEVEISYSVLFTDILCYNNHRERQLHKQTKTLIRASLNCIDAFKRSGNDARSAMVNCFTSTSFIQGSICELPPNAWSRYTALNNVNYSVNDSNK